MLFAPPRLATPASLPGAFSPFSLFCRVVLPISLWNRAVNIHMVAKRRLLYSRVAPFTVFCWRLRADLKVYLNTREPFVAVIALLTTLFDLAFHNVSIELISRNLLLAGFAMHRPLGAHFLVLPKIRTVLLTPVALSACL